MRAFSISSTAMAIGHLVLSEFFVSRGTRHCLDKFFVGPRIHRLKEQCYKRQTNYTSGDAVES